MFIYAHVCVYLCVMNSICGERHIELVYILRKQKVFDTVFYLGDAVFYFNSILMRFLFIIAENGTFSFYSQKGENEKKKLGL